MSLPEADIRVMLVDDHEVVRRGVASILAGAGGIVVCAEASSAAEAVRTAGAVHPDVVVMDVRLGLASGIDATREIRALPAAPAVIMLTSFDDEEALFAAIGAGASGYVLKQIRSDDLVGAIRRVAAGESLLDPGVTGAVLARLRATRASLRHPTLARLTDQEERILGMVAQGLTNRAIAGELYLAEKTIKNHVSNVLSKLGVARRAEAAAHYTRFGAHTEARPEARPEARAQARAS